MIIPDGVHENFLFTVDFGEVEVDVDPSSDFLVRVDKFGAFMLKVVQYDEEAPMVTYFITDNVFELLSKEPVPEHPMGGRLHVDERDFLFMHEYLGLIEARANSLEVFYGD